jgi:nitroreductase
MDVEKIKEPATNYKIHSLLCKRWSPRAFSGSPVEPDKLQRIFEAARWTASSSNLQPWFFLIGLKEDEVYHSIFSTLAEFNQLWAGTAPILLLAISKKATPRGDLNKSSNYDLGQSVAMLSIQATAEGLYVHQMGGFNSEQAAILLEIPQEYEVNVAIAMGYLGNPEILHPNLKKLEYAERSRRPLEETVFTGKFGNKASFI